MSKKIFDRRLFREAMRQSRVCFLTIFIILMLVSVFLPIAMRISFDPMRDHGIYYLTLEELNPLVLFMMYTGGPVLVFLLFRFLYARSDSDFYHAIPQTRLCLFTSFFAAAVFQLFLLLFVPGLSAAGLACLLCKAFRVDFGLLLNHLCHLFVGGVYLMAIVSLGMSLTGSLLSGILVGGMIFCLPRIFTTWADTMVMEELPMVAGGTLIPFVNWRYNIPIGSILQYTFQSLMGGVNTLSSGRSLAYTALLAVLFLFLGGLLFVKRPSETATRPAPTRGLQAVYRFFATLTVSLIPVTMLYSDVQDSMVTQQSIFYLFLAFLFTLVFYLLYELLTTRSWRNLLRAAPGFLLVLAVDAAMAFGLITAYRTVADFAPEAERIQSVSLHFGERKTYSGGTGSVSDYFAARASKLEITSEKSRELVAKGLQKSVEDFHRTGGLNTARNSRGSLSTLPVALKVGGRTYYRNIELTKEERNALYQELGNQKEFAEIYQNLPEDPKTLYVEDLPEGAREVYDALLEELKSLSFAEWYEICEDREYNYFSELIFGEYIDGTMHASLIPISDRLPKTAEAYVEASKKLYLKDLQELLEHPENWDEVDVDLGVFARESAGSFWYHSIYLNHGQNAVSSPAYLNPAQKEGSGPVYKLNMDLTVQQVAEMVRTYGEDPVNWEEDVPVCIRASGFQLNMTEDDVQYFTNEKDVICYLFLPEKLFTE